MDPSISESFFLALSSSFLLLRSVWLVNNENVILYDSIRTSLTSRIKTAAWEFGQTRSQDEMHIIHLWHVPRLPRPRLHYLLMFLIITVNIYPKVQVTVNFQPTQARKLETNIQFLPSCTYPAPTWLKTLFQLKSRSFILSHLPWSHYPTWPPILFDTFFRSRLWSGGLKAIESSPMILSTL